MNKGWECEKCGAVMSPFAMVCINCKGNNETYTSNVELKVKPKIESQTYTRKTNVRGD